MYEKIIKLILFLLIFILILAYSLKFPKVSYTLLTETKNKNEIKWYVLGRVKIRNGEIVSFTISN